MLFDTHLQAGTAMLIIPELEFEVQSGTLGGCFTTVEGLLVQARDQLANSQPFFTGDSANKEVKSKFVKFIEEMNEVWVPNNNGHLLWCSWTLKCTLPLNSTVIPALDLLLYNPIVSMATCS